MEAKPNLATSAAAGTAVESRFRQLSLALVTRWHETSAGQRKRLVAALVATLACVAGLFWYVSRPDWRVLFAGLESDDAREMAATLTGAGIPFDVSSDGHTLRVPAESLDKARLATTAKGGPRSGRMGFELFDKPNWIGSEFDEKVNYQRALEGELEHSVATLGAVESARVHITLPRESFFTDQRRAAKASVLLKLRHRSLSDEEVEGIRNLVASAVEDLPAENVVLVDANGRGSLGAKSADAVSRGIEEALAAKLLATVEPITGDNNVRASVNVEFDTSTSDDVDEKYDPAAVVTLNMQRSEQSSGSLPAAQGVPGTASNTPAAQPPLFPSAAAGAQNQRQESASYGASRHVHHAAQGPGRIKRITAALVVNDRLVPAADKKTQPVWQSRTPQELQRIAQVAQAAIGFDTARGDQVSVENFRFESEAMAASGAPATLLERAQKILAQSGALLRYGTMLLMMLMLVLFVLRPLTQPAKKGKTKVAPQQPALPAAENSAPALAAAGSERPQQPPHAQMVYEQVAGELRRDPAQSSRLLQSWIHSD